MKKIQPALLLLTLCILFGLISQRIVGRLDYPDSDFFSFWLAGHMILTGQNPYMEEGWIEGHTLFGADWISDPTFLYPLPLALFFVPLGLLTLFQAYVAWVWVTQIMLLAVVLLLLPSFEQGRVHYILPVAAGILLFRPLITLLSNGQLGALFLLLVVIAGMLWDRGRWIAGGLVIAFCALKPSIGAPILALVAIYLLVRWHYKAFIGMTLAAVGMLIMGALYDPGWIGQYLQVLRFKQEQTFGYSPTIWGMSALISGFHLPGTLWIGSLITVVLLALYLVMVIKLTHLTPLVAVGLAVTVALVITPYLWPYDQIMLVLPIVLAMAALKKANIGYLPSALVFLAIDVVAFVLLWFSAQSQTENVNGLVPLVVLGIQSFVLFRHHNAVPVQPALTPGTEET